MFQGGNFLGDFSLGFFSEGYFSWVDFLLHGTLRRGLFPGSKFLGCYFPGGQSRK